MATYKHLRSGTANKRPTTSIADGQLAINTNTASPGLFFKDSAGTGIVKVGPVHVGTTAPNSVPAAGGSSGNYLGEQWLDTSVSPAQMKVWNGSTWVGVVADELPVSKLQDGAARQLIQTDAAGTGVEWTSNVDVPGTLDITSTATFDSIAQHPLGSADAPTITFTGDNNTGIYSPGADQVAISTNGQGRLFINSAGDIGIGWPSPSYDLHLEKDENAVTTSYFRNINTGSSAGSRLIAASLVGNLSLQAYSAAHSVWPATTVISSDSGFTGGLVVNASGTNPLRLFTDSSERARIDSSGRLLVGTSTALTNIYTGATAATPQIQLSGAGLNESSLSLLRTGPTGATVFLNAGSSGNAAQSGSILGRFIFNGFDGTNYRTGGQIVCEVDGTPGTDDMPGRIVLSTTADGANTPTERMRITNDGVKCYDQPAPAAVNATATLTVANLKAGIITSTSAAATDMTLPTGTDTEAGFNGVYTNFTFEWSVINTGPSLVRVLAATAHTIVGSGSVATGTSGRFASRRTAANTFVSYRLS